MQGREVQEKYDKFFGASNERTFRGRLGKIREKHGKKDAPRRRKIASLSVNKKQCRKPKVPNMNLKCTATTDPVSEEELDSVDGADSFIDDEGIEKAGGRGGELLICDHFFKPILNVGTWEYDYDGDTTAVSVAILLISGMEKKCDFTVNLRGDQILEYIVRWSLAMSDCELLQEKWLNGRGFRKLERYHNMVNSFKKFLGRMRLADDRVWSTALIPLPIPVDSRITTFTLKYLFCCTKVLHLILRAPKTHSVEDKEGEI